jgi:hypothetical protein
VHDQLGGGRCALRAQLACTASSRSTAKIARELGAAVVAGRRPVSIRDFSRCSASTMPSASVPSSASAVSDVWSARLASKKSWVESSAAESALFTSWPRRRSSRTVASSWSTSRTWSSQMRASSAARSAIYELAATARAAPTRASR